MKKNYLLILALACGMAFSSCGKKDAASAISDSTKEVAAPVEKAKELPMVEIKEGMDTTRIATGSPVTRVSRCKVCSCGVYRGEYLGYFTSCFNCNHSYGMH